MTLPPNSLWKTQGCHIAQSCHPKLRASSLLSDLVMHPLVRQSHNGPPERKAEDEGVNYKLFGLGMLRAMEPADTMDSPGSAFPGVSC